MAKSVLIIGEDPSLVDFEAPDAPEGMSAERVMAGLNSAADRLRAQGCEAKILLTKDQETVEEQVVQALAQATYDVIVVGAGLRTLPPMARQLEVLINVLHRQVPESRIAFNSQPDDSDEAAARWLAI
jgi:hypothetical protein